MDHNQVIRQILVQSGVIGRVLRDFNPRVKLFLSYGNMRISLGGQLTLAEVQRRPDRIEHQFLDPESYETINQGYPVHPIALVMTDPGAPGAGAEYVHWIILYHVSSGAADGFPFVEKLPYEPPRPGARMIVFTFFLPTIHFSCRTIFENHIGLPPMSRENFSTLDFVDFNAVGPSLPLGAAFFYIGESSTSRNAVESESSDD